MSRKNTVRNILRETFSALGVVKDSDKPDDSENISKDELTKKGSKTVNSSKTKKEIVKSDKEEKKIIFPSNMSKVDSVRYYVYVSHLVPAKKRGQKTVTVRASDVRSSLGFNDIPTICSALKTRIDKLYDVKILSVNPSEGNRVSTTVQYDLENLYMPDGNIGKFSEEGEYNLNVTKRTTKEVTPKSTASKSTASKSTSSKSTASKSAASKSAASKSTASKSSTSGSTASMSAASKSATSRSAASKSAASKSSTSRSVPSKSTASVSSTSKSSVSRTASAKSEPETKTATDSDNIYSDLFKSSSYSSLSSSSLSSSSLSSVSFTDSSGYYEECYMELKNLEELLRDFVSSSLEIQFGKRWWDKTDMGFLAKRWEDRRIIHKRTTGNQSGNKPEDLIMYASFSDYRRIINNPFAWKVFEEHFPDRNWIIQRLKELDPIRNAIMHHTPIDEDDIIRLGLYSRDIRKAITKK